MLGNNQTTVTKFLLLGFARYRAYKFWIFFLTLSVYIATVVGNLLIITLVLLSPYLKSPMYFFLSNLYVSDTIVTTNIIPNMLRVTWQDGGTISFVPCLFQLHIHGSSSCAGCFLLTAMSYDRYLAICNPLRYTAIMEFKLCLQLGLFSWFFGFLVPVMSTIMISCLEFCGTNTINHFFCDLVPLLEISCSDISFVKLEIFLASVFVLILPPILIILSYVYILITVLKIPSTSGRQKVFSTCSSHLTVVCVYYGTVLAIYTIPSSKNSIDTDKFLSLLYTVVTPLLNPIIYGLRSQEIRNALSKLIG
ncbi:olfactory receptor 478-like [Bombina bombina]|uniref:olfactory receptor 478-like n=1 Tax=Bombina bombina TaxID=8345 RepID=UPI00235AC439|nr:olfactory receptor 478-like [Bombina bombina]